MDAYLTLVVRQFGSDRKHVSRVRRDDLMDVTILGGRSEVVALDPVATVCGANLRESRGPVIAMRKAVVNCRPCHRLSGITSAADTALSAPSEELARG